MTLADVFQYCLRVYLSSSCDDRLDRFLLLLIIIIGTNSMLKSRPTITRVTTTVDATMAVDRGVGPLVVVFVSISFIALELPTVTLCV